MPSSEYASTPSTGKLKLKGVKDSKITKKRSRKDKSMKDGRPSEDVEDSSAMLRRLEEDRDMAQEKRMKQTAPHGPDITEGEDEDRGLRCKTEAERRYEDQRRKRLDERLKREGVKTHKERVEELNRYLSGLSEHHDMPRIGPG